MRGPAERREKDCLQLTPSEQAGVSYLCVPMIAQGDAIGVLHFRSKALAQPDGAGSAPRQLDQQLAVTVAEQSSSALANLKLRDSLRQQSIRDPLTHLFNRRYLKKRWSANCRGQAARPLRWP